MSGKAATVASYRINHVLVKHKKPFKDGKMVKAAFLEAEYSLSGDFKNKCEIMAAFESVELSRNRVT